MFGDVPCGGKFRMRLLKVQPGVEVHGVVVSEVVASLRLHWLGGRSWVCPVEDCPLCCEAPSRWVGFLSLLVNGGAEKRPQVFLCELSESAWHRFDFLFRLSGSRSLLGLRVVLSRKRVRQPLFVDPMGAGDLGDRKPLQGWMIYSALATLYGLAVPLEGEDLLVWAGRIRGAVVRQLEGAMSRAK